LSSSLSRERIELSLFRAGYVLVTILLLSPLVVVVGTSFNRSGSLVFPPQSISLKWYSAFLSDALWIKAVNNSIVVATGTTALSTAIGLLAALGVEYTQNRWVTLIVGVGMIPLLVPPIVLGVSLLIYLSMFGLQQSYPAIVIAHSLWATPIVFFVMRSVFARFDWALWEAGLDLGASPSRAFRHVMLPSIKTGVLVSALLAFIVSLQEFVMALFLSGFGTRTVPVYAWLQMRNNLDPVISVVSTLLILVSVLAIAVAASLSSVERLAEYL
jgi:putative spermidine/putrescine transport system permease protein/spermidine/putrescine transport system permease protein